MRNLTVLIIALALVMGVSTSAVADHGDEVDGLWESTDPVDGSRQMLRISERADGTFSIGYIDFLATQACEPDAFFRSGGTGTYDDSNEVFTGTLTNPRCAGRAAPVAATFSFSATFDPTTNTLIDSMGVTWNHVAG